MARQVQVLLWKDWLILGRSWRWLCLLTLVPILLSSVLWYLWAVEDSEYQPEKHNFDMTKYAKIDYQGKSFLNSDMSNYYRANQLNQMRGNLTAVSSCIGHQKREVGMVASPKVIEKFGTFIKNDFENLKLNLVMYERKEDLFDAVQTNHTLNFCFGFQLKNLYPQSNQVDVEIYTPFELQSLIQPHSQGFDSSLSKPNWYAYNKTFETGQPHLMIHITQIINMVLRGQKMKEVELAFIPMKTPSYHSLSPQSIQKIIRITPPIITMIYFLPLYYLCLQIVEEPKAREGLKIMGLTDQHYYKALFIFTFGLASYVTFWTVSILQLDTFSKSDRFMLWTAFFIHCGQMFGVALFISAIKRNKKFVNFLCFTLWLFSNLVINGLRGSNISIDLKVLCAFLVPNAGLGMFLDLLIHLEMRENKGLNFDTILVQNQQKCFVSIFVLMVLSGFIWAFLGFYFDQVMPKEFGRTQKYNFLCTKKKKVSKTNLEKEEQDPQLVKLGNFEFTDSNKGFCIRNLNKTYKINNTKAVDNVSLTMQENEVFVLLGHNGAGKTSILNILTGLTDPDSGQVCLDSIDIFENTELFRQQLGYCPQQNVLFPSLTVREHLELFCSLRGKLQQYEINRKVDKMISQIELEDVQYQASSTLSGGQRRKLSVAICLIADSKMIILDEPTSGMDTTTRRQFWDLIKQYKRNKIVLITTHYMDEADVLGDKICIMKEGKVQCCGSPMFLKTRFEVGYQIKLALNQKHNANGIKKVFDCVKVLEFTANKNEIEVKVADSDRKKFQALFERIENEKDQLGIQSYGVSVSSLEDVFLKVGYTKQPELEKTPQKLVKKTFVGEVKTQLRKRMILQCNTTATLMTSLILPLLCLLGILHLIKYDFVPSPSPPTLLTLDGYPQTETYVNEHNFNQSSLDLSLFISNNYPNANLYSPNQNQAFFSQLATIDSQLFDLGDNFVQPFIQQANINQSHYAIASFVNVTQTETPLIAAASTLQSILRHQLSNPDFKLNFYQGSLPFSSDDSIWLDAYRNMLESCVLVIALVQICLQQGMQIIKNEERNKLKQQLMLSGVSSLSYWLANIGVDVALQILVLFLVGQTQLIVVVFAVANSLFIACFNKIVQTKGMIVVRLVLVLVGAAAPITTQILSVSSRYHKTQALTLHQLGRIFPFYSFIFSFLQQKNEGFASILGQITNKAYEELRHQKQVEYLYKQTVVYAILLFLLESGLLAILARPIVRPIQRCFNLIHHSLLATKKWQAYDIRQISSMHDFELLKNQTQTLVKDTDPEEEHTRISSQKPDKFSIKVESLSKEYAPFRPAVKNISFGLQKGDCFALLGVTGAGKTTTFKCLCQEERPDSGQLWIQGFDCLSKRGFKQARQSIGYCPQFDCLYAEMSVRQHLEFYSCVKGLVDWQEQVNYFLCAFDLIKYQNVRADNLSGGNKRKLNCAIALIGSPQVVLLDEPTTGVDPFAKRLVWRAISQLSTVSQNSTVVLTTHSMEEAEALCPRIGIMVDGEFKCLGSAQHIKSKYAKAYEVTVRIAMGSQIERMLMSAGFSMTQQLDDREVYKLIGLTTLAAQVEKIDLISIFRHSAPYLASDVAKWLICQQSALQIQQALTKQFTSCTLKDHFQQMFQYQLPTSKSIGDLFATLETLKQQKLIEEYSAGQESLEQVFATMANQKGIHDRLRKFEKRSWSWEEVQQCLNKKDD